MFARVKSLGSLTMGSNGSSAVETRRRWLRLKRHRSMSCSGSSSDGEDSVCSEAQTMRRVESYKHVCRTASKTRRGWLRFASRAYEREWRRERGQPTTEPIVVYIGTSHMEDVDDCDCDCCPCIHDQW